MFGHEVVQATLSDLKGIWELEKRTFSAVDVFKLRQLRYLLTSPKCITLVVRGKTKLILAEIVGLLRHFTTPSGRIYKIAVDSSLQGHGIGSKLIAVVERIFRDYEMFKCCAEVRKSNVISQKLFLKCGYSMTEQLPQYYPDGENGVKFWKDL